MIKDKRTSLSKKTFIENTGKYKIIYLRYSVQTCTDFKVFKNEMITIQSNIQNLKTHIKSKLTSIQQEMSSLDEDVNLYSDRMTDWCTKVTINEYPALSHYKQSTSFVKHRVKVRTIIYVSFVF